MPSITRAQYQKLNDQAPDGWRFDLQQFVTWGEKSLKAIHTIDDDHLLIGCLEYCENRADVRTEYGQVFTRPTGFYHIALHLNVYHRSGDVCIGHGVGVWIDLDHGQHSRKVYKNLCKIAESVSPDDFRKLYDSHRCM